MVVMGHLYTTSDGSTTTCKSSLPSNCGLTLARNTSCHHGTGETKP